MADIPEFYRMPPDTDVFGFLKKLPLPKIPEDHLMGILGIYSTGFRYARRALWKGNSPSDMAKDCLKAAVCFMRLAEELENIK